MDLVDKSEADLQRGAAYGARAGAVIARHSVRLTARVGQRATHYSLSALVALLQQIRQITHARRSSGELSLRQFTRAVTEKREVLPLNDRVVARALARELRRHGVTFAVERSADGTRYFHVEGRNAELVEHALRLAAMRVDEQIRRAAARRQGDDGRPGRDEVMDEERTRVEIPETDRATLTAAVVRAGRITPEVADDVARAVSSVQENGTLTLNPELVAALDTAHIEVEQFASPDLSRQLAEAMAEERAVGAVAPTTNDDQARIVGPGGEEPAPADNAIEDGIVVDVPARADRPGGEEPAPADSAIEDGLVVAEVHGQEREQLAQLLDDHADWLGARPKDIILTDVQRDLLIAEIGRQSKHLEETGAGDRRYADLVREIEQTGAITRDEGALEAVSAVFERAGWNEALTDPDGAIGLPYDMTEVVVNVGRAVGVQPRAGEEIPPSVTVFYQEGRRYDETIAGLEAAGISYRAERFETSQWVIPGAFGAPVVVDNTTLEAWSGHRPEQFAGITQRSLEQAQHFSELAEEVRRDGTVALDASNVESLHTVIVREGWEPGGAQTPQNLSWLVDHVEAERERTQDRAVKERFEERFQALAAQEPPGRTEGPDEPRAQDFNQVRRNEPRPVEPEGKNPYLEAKPDRLPDPKEEQAQPVRRSGREDHESPPHIDTKHDLRNATRKRLADRIGQEVAAKTQQGSLSRRDFLRAGREELPKGRNR